MRECIQGGCAQGREVSKCTRMHLRGAVGEGEQRGAERWGIQHREEGKGKMVPRIRELAGKAVLIY